MIDIKVLREHPERVRAAISRKKFTVDLDSILELDTVRRTKITESEQARAELKTANQAMAKLEKGSPEFLEKVSEMKSVSARAKALEVEAKEAD